MGYIKGFIEFMKLPNRIIGAIWLTTGTALLFANNLSGYLFLDEKINEYGWLMGLAFLITSGLLAVEIIMVIYTTVREKIAKIIRFKSNTIKLQKLNNKQKCYIHILYTKLDVDTTDFEETEDANDMVINAIVDKELVGYAGYNNKGIYSFTLQKWVQLYLKENPIIASQYQKIYIDFLESEKSKKIRQYTSQ